MKTSKENLSQFAKTLREALSKTGATITHSQSLEIAAKLLGQRNLHVLQAALAKPAVAEHKKVRKVCFPAAFGVPYGQSPKPNRIREWVDSIMAKEPAEDRSAVPKDVYLHQFLVSVLVDDNREYDPELDVLAYDIRDGDCIGDFEKIGVEKLAHHETPPVLCEIRNDGEYFGTPTPCTPEGEIFLTNALGEDTGNITDENLSDLGLDFNKVSGYPLSDSEAKLLQEEIVLHGNIFQGNYATLKDGKKYHCPTAELAFADPFWGENPEHFPSRDVALEKGRALKAKLDPEVKTKGGDIVLEGYLPGRICVRLRIPFEK